MQGVRQLGPADDRASAPAGAESTLSSAAPLLPLMKSMLGIHDAEQPASASAQAMLTIARLMLAIRIGGRTAVSNNTGRTPQVQPSAAAWSTPIVARGTRRQQGRDD